MKLAWVDITERSDPRGTLRAAEWPGQVPFDVRRVFSISDVPRDAERGGHAHRTLHHMLLCLSGTFRASVHDGATMSVAKLSPSARGLHVPPMHWLALDRFLPGTVCLVLCSAPYDEGDYVREFQQFLQLSRQVQ